MAISSSTEIANMALSHLGQGQAISNLSIDTSEAALACRVFYESSRDELLKELPWPFATRFADLGLVEEEPLDEWGYSYRYPSDSLFIRRIISGARQDSRQSKIPYKIAQDDDGLLLYTDLEDASIEYTVQVTDVTYFPVDFVLALSYKLAWYIAPRVTKADPFNLRKGCAEAYAILISQAAANAFNEEAADEVPQAEWIAGRD